MNHNPMYTQVVSIKGVTPEGRAAIERYGNSFWKRQLLYEGKVYLIPVKDGVPNVASFVILSQAELYTDEELNGIQGSYSQRG